MGDKIMDVKAQWQLIFVALWSSGAFDTQEAAKRKTDEIIANRPSFIDWRESAIQGRKVIKDNG